jgi:hypothetical protein
MGKHNEHKIRTTSRIAVQMKTLAFASAVLLFPLVANAQQTTDPKWNAWLGCWELVVENARDAATRPSPSRRTLSQAGNNSRAQVCVEPSGNGVTLTTRVANQEAIQQTIIADGVEHPIDDAECRGTQRAEWSADGRKLYSRADLDCSNDKGNRRVSGFSILGVNGTWTDIQAVDISGQQTVRVRSYRRVSELAQTGKGLTHASPLTLDDVKEAATKVSPRTLEAALVETGSSFDLSGKNLVSLQDAKVPGSVTDLMVALSYPKRFIVERTAHDDTTPIAPLVDDPFFVGWAFGYPAWGDFGFYSPLYGPYSPYFYSPFYSYLPWYYPRYYGNTYYVVGDGNGSGGGAGAGGQPRPSGAGRVVDGLGYTRVRPREAEPTAAGSIGSTSGSVSSSGGSSSSGGGGGSVSSSGFSSGGSSGDGGRTAQPR